MINNIQGILFDMDGTVLDSEGLFEEAQLLFLKEYGIISNRNELEQFKGLSYKHFYPKFIKKFSICKDIDFIRFKLRTYLHKIMESKLKFIDGFEVFYNSYIKDSKLKIGLVTNTTRLSYQKIQTCINIDDYFNFVLTVDEVKEPKPSPYPYLQSMEFLSLDKNQTLIIEDSKTGLLSAVKSGATVIGITTSLTIEEIKDINKNILVFDSYNDISNYLSNLINKY